MQIMYPVASGLSCSKKGNVAIVGCHPAGGLLKSGGAAELISRRIRVRLGVAAIAFAFLAQAPAATVTWTGASSTLWNNAGNWTALPAASGDSLVFSGSVNMSNTNDFTGRSFVGITFNSSGWALDGNAITLTGGPAVTASGNAIMNMNITYSGNKIFAASTGVNLTLGGNIVGGGEFRTNGGGTVILSGTNSFGGQILINFPNSTLQFTSAASVGSSPLVISSLSTLAYAGSSNATVGNTLSLFAGGATKTISSMGSGAIKFSGSFTNAADNAAGVTLLLTGTSAAANEVAGNLVNSSVTLSVNKGGSGRWILSGTNSYTGTTAVSAGTLLVNGSHTNAANYTVAASAVLGGSGTIVPGGSSNITVSANGVLAPGASIGTLTINSGNSSAGNILSLQNGATLSFELNSFGPADLRSDTIALLNGSANDIAFNGNVINFTDLSLGSLAFGNYLLFSANLAGAYGGLTVDGNGVIVSGLLIGSGLGGYDGSVLKLIGNDIYLSVVPEPGTWVLVAGGFTFLVVMRRRYSAS